MKKKDGGLVLLFVGGLVFAFSLFVHNMLQAKDGDMFYENGVWYTYQVNPVALGAFFGLAILGAVIMLVGVVVFLGYRENESAASYYQRPEVHYHTKETPKVLPVNYCPGCGRQTGMNALFCEGCGRRLQ